ncbi:MAG: hypothetical protein NTZ84_03150 [Candidatus Nealsonbacteria bacterium]|nr:hypothetical protein [Candidatus Nealsonbacteria bacterium]
MNKIARDFISEENRQYNFKFGQVIASSLSGFICGSVVVSMIWMVILKSLNIF